MANFTETRCMWHYQRGHAGAAKKEGLQKDVELGASRPTPASPRDSSQGTPQGTSRNPQSSRGVPGANGEYVGLPSGPAKPEKRGMLGMLGGLMRPNSRGGAHIIVQHRACGQTITYWPASCS